MARLLLPDKDPHAVSALRNKRAALAGEIAMHTAEIARLRGELVHMDAVLRLFDPDTDPDDVPALRRWPRKTDWFARGEIAQRVYEALRTQGAVSPTQFTDDAIKAKGWDGMSGKARRDIIARFSSILYTMTRRGQLVKVGRGQGVKWTLAPTEPDFL
jgi:hypothetical protein